MTLFDTTSDKIILISYPSGGFGNFLYYVLTEFADYTVKIPNYDFSFSSSGDSHSTIKYTNTYNRNTTTYLAKIKDGIDTLDKKILVLCDNGINDDSYTKINEVFPKATIVRVVIDLPVRPVIFKTLVIKAMNKDIANVMKDHVAQHWTDYNKDFAVRENFTLFYHNWSFGWHANNSCVNVSLESLITDTYNTVTNLITSLEMQVINCQKLIKTIYNWKKNNDQYFQIYYEIQKIEHALDNDINYNLAHINDLHDQGYINYWLEKKYKITIPVYDYKNWFISTNQIQKVIEVLREK